MNGGLKKSEEVCSRQSNRSARALRLAGLYLIGSRTSRENGMAEAEIGKGAGSVGLVREVWFEQIT